MMNNCFALCISRRQGRFPRDKKDRADVSNCPLETFLVERVSKVV